MQILARPKVAWVKQAAIQLRETPRRVVEEYQLKVEWMQKVGRAVETGAVAYA
jgi:hypothetical protein